MSTLQRTNDAKQSDAQPNPRKRSRLRMLALLTALVVIAANLVWNVLENFHTVIPDLVYRSGQLGSGSLESKIERHKIQSIINLRGENPEDGWYLKETAVAERKRTVLHDLALDSQFPKEEELKQLIGILESCPKPVLIHCSWGTDRTGMAAAICVLLLDDSGSPEKALAQLSWRFGHLPSHPSTEKLNAFVQSYQTWLTAQDSAHSPERFREWVLRVLERGDLKAATTAPPAAP